MNGHTYKALVEAGVVRLSAATGRPAWWAEGGGTNRGALSANYNAIYGGWVMVEAANEGGAEHTGPLGFPSHRVHSKEFLLLIDMALWWATR